MISKKYRWPKWQASGHVRLLWQSMPVRKQLYSASSGRTKFMTTASTATGNKPDVISMPSVSGRCCMDFGTACKPMPTDIDVARIIILRRVQLTVDSMLTPADTTMPNMRITPPPSTSIGIEDTTAPIFGTKPQMIRKMAPMVTTPRLITPVMETMPTFWLKEVFGRPPKIPATADPRPSA